MTPNEGKTFLRDDILIQVYQRSRFKHVKFEAPTMCPSCGSEYATRVSDQMLMCGHCGVFFKEKGKAADAKSQFRTV